jgi:hypothetical protein
MKFVRRSNKTNFVEDKIVSITIGAGGGTDTDTLVGIQKNPDTAIEVELDDGTIVVLLGYTRK